jgi:peptidoglycan/LPS O-acetylase OafA/YrhL
MSANTRMAYLDSLKGLAAYIVVIGHFFPGEWKNLPIFNLITDTKLAVAIFYLVRNCFNQLK